MGKGSPHRRALFITASDSLPPVKGDRDLLEREGFIVQYFFYKGGDPKRILLAQTRLFLWLCRHLWNASLIFIWFADLHAFWPVVLGKFLRRKVVVVVGGYEVAREAWGYGAQHQALRRLVIRLCCRLADKVLGVSRFLRSRIRSLLKVEADELCPAIYHIPEPPPQVQFEWDMVTVCGGHTLQRLLTKGIDFFVEVSRRMPDRKFLIIGLEGEARRWVEERRPDNLTVTGSLRNEEVYQLLVRSRVVCQFSRYEGSAGALGEAMAVGCIPVGLSCGGIPERIGDAGFLIDKLEVQDALQAVEKALNAPDSLREKARRRIRTLFSPEVREAKLREVLRELGIRRG